MKFVNNNAALEVDSIYHIISITMFRLELTSSMNINNKQNRIKYTIFLRRTKDKQRQRNNDYYFYMHQPTSLNQTIGFSSNGEPIKKFFPRVHNIKKIFMKTFSKHHHQHNYVGLRQRGIDSIVNDYHYRAACELLFNDGTRRCSIRA